MYFLVLFLIILFIYKCTLPNDVNKKKVLINTKRKQKKAGNEEEKEIKRILFLNISEIFNCSIIKIINPPSEYDKEVFFPKDANNNPSIYSKYYEDFYYPKKFSTINEMKKEAEKIYQVPEKYKNCLGGSNLIFFTSSTGKTQSNMLYCPLYFGFYRNQSSKSLFNLVKTGVLSLQVFTVHLPATTVITNNTNKPVQVNIPKGTILEGTNDKQTCAS